MSVDGFTPPPFEHPETPRWATYISDRRPKFKVHNGRGAAINAAYLSLTCRGARGGIIYQLAGGQWLVWRVVERGEKYEGS